MKLKLQRTTEINDTVLGELSINNKFFCYTLEDRIRDVKIKHETCISPGIYKILLTLSQRFKRVLPILLNVPNFEGIRIHAGNFNTSTSGCILVGSAINGEMLLHSKTTLERLLVLMNAAIKRKEEIEIEILNPIIIKPIESIIEPILPILPITKPKPKNFTILNIIKWIQKFISKNW